jgi:hypothetical protein
MSPRRNWDSPNLSLPSECAPPPRTGGRGAQCTLASGCGVESQFRRLKKKLSTLPTLYTILYAMLHGIAHTSVSDPDPIPEQLFTLILIPTFH